MQNTHGGKRLGLGLGPLEVLGDAKLGEILEGELAGEEMGEAPKCGERIWSMPNLRIILERK